MCERCVPAPDTTSWSEVATYRQCPRKHQFQYIDRWRPPKVSKPLAIGILWHEIQEHHYLGVQATGDVRDPGKEALERIIELLNQNGAKDPDHPDHAIGSVCLWMYHGYRQWAAEQDGGWKIHDVEVEFRTALPGTDIELVGRIDLIVEAYRHLWICDHKASRNLPAKKELELDDQTPLYIWAVRQLGYDVRGAFLSYSRTNRLQRPMTLEERFVREPIWRTDYELEQVVREATASIQAAYSPAQAHERHPDPQNCKWRCPYLEPCLGGRKAEHLEVNLLQSLRFTQKPRRLQVVSED